MTDETFKKRMSKLDNAIKIQTSKGNYDANEYMKGMANGLILAEAILKNKDPKYK